MSDDTLKLGYDSRPRTWYQEINPEDTEFRPENRDEEAIKELIPTGDKEVFKSHLERGKESKRPLEVVIQRLEDDSFYRATYKRQVDDLSTSDATLQDVRDAEYLVEVMQGNESAGAHRYGNTDFNGLPEEIQNIFKTHDEKQWRENP